MGVMKSKAYSCKDYGQRCPQLARHLSSNNIIVVIVSHEVLTVTYLLPVFLSSTLEGSLVFRELSKLRQRINNRDLTLMAEYLLCKGSFFGK